MLPHWNHPEKFKKHLRAMEFFRLAHTPLPEDEPEKMVDNNCTQQTSAPSATNLFTDEKGNVIVIPIWEIELPGGIQN